MEPRCSPPTPASSAAELHSITEVLTRCDLLADELRSRQPTNGLLTSILGYRITLTPLCYLATDEGLVATDSGRRAD